MNAPKDQIQQQKTPTNLVNLQEQNTSLLAQSYSHREAAEGKIVTLQNQLEDSQKRNVEFFGVIEELTIERDCLQREIFRVEDVVRGREKELLRRIDDGLREKECLEVEIYEGVREREGLVRKIDLGLREKEGLLKDFDVFKGKNEELEDKLSRGFGVIGLIKGCLIRVNESFGEENLDSGVNHEGGIMEENTSNIDGKKLGRCKGMEGFLEDLDLVSKMAKRVEEKLLDHGEKEGLLSEIEAYKCWNNELRASLSKGLEVLGLVKESLKRINECLDENNLEIWIDQDSQGVLNLEEELERLENEKLVLVSSMAKRIEDKMKAHLEKMKKEKQELERNVMSLTEENRDAIALLRIALIEKQEMEKSVSKLKDSNNNEQWKVPLLQFAERGLQRVGFGFMIGGPSNEEDEDQKKIVHQNSDIMSDVSSECEEEVFSLASTVEKMMKNLRIEITRLRRDFDNSRIETERLQSLMEKQALRISELTIYTNELEDRERILMQNVEELLISIKATEEEVERWRKACELEVEAAKHVAQEHNYLVAILKQELEKTRTTLQVSEKKLKLKEEVAVAAIAAQSAAERSVQLADARVARLLEKIEELTTQVEEAESKQKNNRHRRRMCWPWHALNSSFRVQNFDIRQTLPEMQAFIQ